MSGIELLNPTRKGWQAADLGNRLHRLVVIQDEAIRQVVRPTRSGTFSTRALSTTEQLSYRAAIESAEESSDNRQVDCAEVSTQPRNREVNLAAAGMAIQTLAFKPDAMGIQHK
jgi:hypothetical protein